MHMMTEFDKLVRLADNLYSRFEARGNPSDLSLCIVHYRSALTLAKSSTSLSSDARSKLFSNLANVLSIRFQRHGDVADLDHSVECHLAALDLRPPGHPGHAKSLSHFAAALLVRYGQHGVQQDIELAIEHFTTALPVLPPDARLAPLMNYASALFSRFQHTGDVLDLNDAIRQYRAVVDASPSEHKSTSYYNLANALLSRFKLEKDSSDLELSVHYSSIALRGMSKSHPDRHLALSCLSTALVRRFEANRNPGDLQNAVKHFQSALELSPGDAPKCMTFYDLADALMIRYRLLSDFADLELAIGHYCTALDLLDAGCKNEGIFLGDLGNALFLRFSSLGHPNDLEEAIQKHYLALEAHPAKSVRRLFTLEALGACLDARFQQSGDPEDLDTAIDLYNKALIEMLPENPQRPSALKRSASSLERRFGLYRLVVDLDRTISYCREALELLAPDHPDQSILREMLASSLLLRFEEIGDEFDLDAAYLYCGASMRIQHTYNSSRPACNLLLARIFMARVLPWEVKDIESIFHRLHLAKENCTLTHPLISDVYAELASAYYLRFLFEQKPSDLHDAFGLRDLSTNVGTGSLWPAFRASLRCIKDAEMHGHHSGIDIYRGALRLLDRHVSTTRSPVLRQWLARRYSCNLACDGATFALRFQDPVEAIETLESGRSVLWTQMVRAMTSLDDLRHTGEYGASLADEYERLSSLLGRVPAGGTSKASKEVKFMLKEREAVAEQIRRVEGFKSFLKPTPLSDLERAAIDGPVIVLIASQHACNALILLQNMSPVHVPLTDTTSTDVLHMATRFRELTGTISTSDSEEALEYLLSQLWDVVVFPIMQHLIPLTPRGSRLWWCPTGIFTSLPLHAAGPCREDEPSLSHLYVSSYTPTLQALMRARTPSVSEGRRSRRSSIVPGFLKNKKSKTTLTHPISPTIVAIGSASSDDTCRELDQLRNRLPPWMSFRRIEGEEVSSETVLAAFRETVWLHLACPASLDTFLPCKSGFSTGEGMVSLSDIARVRPLAEFAFLSGQCNRGDNTGLEELMHLAASLQYSGVRSVVGTLWPVDEEAMRQVSGAFYERVIPRAGVSMHYASAARSLNEALTEVGRGMSLAQRIAFVHIGA